MGLFGDFWEMLETIAEIPGDIITTISSTEIEDFEESIRNTSSKKPSLPSENKTALLESKCAEYTDSCCSLETAMAEQAKAYFDKFLKKIKGMKKLAGSEMQTDFLQRAFSQYSNDISGSLSKHLNQRVVISDSECASILRESRGATRTSHLNDFTKKVIREGYEDCIKQMQKTASYGIDFAESILKSKIQDMQRVKVSKQQELERITRELSSKALTGKKKEYATKRQVLDTFLSGCGTLQSANQHITPGRRRRKESYG
jgi:hypothetical protein